MARKMSSLKRKGYVYVTFVFFIVSIALHWIFGWKVFVSDQLAHHQPVVFSEYAAQMLRDTFENWQSEFLQLIWQVAGLAFLLYTGSPQSKEGDQRIEEKLDWLIRNAAPKDAERLLDEWKEKYPDK